MAGEKIRKAETFKGLDIFVDDTQAVTKQPAEEAKVVTQQPAKEQPVAGLSRMSLGEEEDK